MGTIAVPNTFSPNTTIASSQVNSNFTTIYNEFNGNIAAANLATGAVTTAKIADSNVTTAKIADSNVTTAKIAADAVTAAKIDWASTGAGAGIWWEELGRTTLASAGDTITVSALPARKYLRVQINTFPTGGSGNPVLQFNGDTGNNYAFRYSNGDTSTASTSGPNISASAGASNGDTSATFDVVNVAARVKQVIGITSDTSGASAANAPGTRWVVGKWVNTSSQINRVDITNLGSGDFAIGSEVVVLGHD